MAATDRHTAEEAVSLIKVEYEELPFVLEPEEALRQTFKSVQRETFVLLPGRICADG